MGKLKCQLTPMTALRMEKDLSGMAVYPVQSDGGIVGSIMGNRNAPGEKQFRIELVQVQLYDRHHDGDVVRPRGKIPTIAIMNVNQKGFIAARDDVEMHLGV